MRKHPVDETCRGDARIRDEHRPRDAERRELVAEARDRAGPVDETGRDADGSDDVDLDGHAALLGVVAQGVTAATAERYPVQALAAPAFGVLEVVEREDVEAGDLLALEHGAEAVDSGSGLKPPGRRKRLAKLPFLRRKRSESPIPMRVETRSSFARLTTPGTPT